MSIADFLRKRAKFFLFLFLTFLPLSFVFSPLLHDGFFPTMDDVQVVRIEEMYKELRSGQFPVRIASDLANGASYMLFNFYSPVVYYIGAAYHFLGFTLVQSTKLTFLTGFLVAWLGAFLLLNLKLDKLSAFFGATLFFSAAYFGYDVFHRGALAEFFALSLLPLLFYSFLKLAKTGKPAYLSLSSLLVALLIAGHNLTALILGPFLLVFVFLVFEKKKALGITALVLGALIATFYWLPALYEQQFIAIREADFVVNTYKSHFLSPAQLIGFAKIPWGFKPPVLGINLFLGSLVALLLIFLKKSRDRFILFSIFAFFLSLFMASNLSRPVWEVLAPVLSFLQFPWRFLSLATFFAAVSSAFFLSKIQSLKLKTLAGLVLTVPLFTLYFSYLRPIEYNYISEYRAEDPCGTAGWANEFMPSWVEECIPKDHELGPVMPSEEPVQVKGLTVEEHGRIYKFTAAGPGEASVTKYYFPGWEAKIDNKPSEIKPSSPHGLISLSIPEGEHRVLLEFKNTPVRTLANIFSIGGVIILFALVRRRPNFLK